MLLIEKKKADRPLFRKYLIQMDEIFCDSVGKKCRIVSCTNTKKSMLSSECETIGYFMLVISWNKALVL